MAFFIGCDGRDIKKDKKVEWNDIDVIVFQDVGRYIFKIKDAKDPKRLKIYQVHNMGEKDSYRCHVAEEIMDVPEGKLPYATAKMAQTSYQFWHYDLQIHVRRNNDMEMGDWERREGKGVFKGRNLIIK